MLPQIVPSTSGNYIAKAFEDEFEIKFNGPGMYVSNTRTILVVPVHRTYAEQWHQKSKMEDELFQVCVYNVAFEHTIFATIGGVPNRMDTRD